MKRIFVANDTKKEHTCLMSETSAGIFEGLMGGKLISRLRGGVKAFSLMEVTLAMGVVSFVLMTIVGTLPVGLQAVRDAQIQTAKAMITGQIRGMVEQLAFEQASQEELYFTRDGMKAMEAGDRYFEAQFTVKDAEIQTNSGLMSFQSSNAQQVEVTLSYPSSAPANNRKEIRFSLFSARQGSAISGLGDSE